MAHNFETLWVRYIHPENGFSIDQWKCEKYLEYGKSYKVTKLYKVNTWMVQVELEEIGDKCFFNSSMFDFENDRHQSISKKIVFNSPQYESYWSLNT